VAVADLGRALKGGVAFLTRIPVGSSEGDWRSFQTVPAVFPAVGYLVGAVTAVPFLVLSGPAAALSYVVALVALVGVTHLDGVADLADAAVVHDATDRRSALKDTTTGVGALVAVAVVVAGLALAGLALAGLSTWRAAAIVVASEVGAKLGMATVACVGTASHDGLGAGFTRAADPPLLVGPVVVAAPAALLTGVSPAAPVAVVAGPLVAVAVLRWADEALGGVNGDVFGAVNEIARLVALHAGVVAWTRF